MNKKNKKQIPAVEEPALKVAQVVEVVTPVIEEVIEKPVFKHKKRKQPKKVQSQGITEYPPEVAIVLENQPVIKRNWLQKQYDKFIVWYKA